MEDERNAVNPDKEINADNVNLLFWQEAGLSLCAPKAFMRFDPPGDEAESLEFGLFSWDDTIYIDQPVQVFPSFITSYTVNGTGDYSVVFDNQVLGRPDEIGVQQLEPLFFQLGMAHINLFSGGSRGFAEFELVSPQEFRIRLTRGGFASNQPYAVAVW